MAATPRHQAFTIPAGLAMLAAAIGLRAPSRGRWRMPGRIEPTVAPEAPRSERVEKLLAAARTTPDLQMIEWDADEASAAAAAPPREEVAKLEPRRRKLRDRYIGARFPGIARAAADLADAAGVVEAARLAFEDGRTALAFELLDLAVAEYPQETATALARMELRFLAHDAPGFVAAAGDFANKHPGHEAWEEITRLGRALAPREPLFGASRAARAHEHYGPWPHLPNWICAPWDLTAEVCAADFHRALALA
jgi:hypothetical protein